MGCGHTNQCLQNILITIITVVILKSINKFLTLHNIPVKKHLQTKMVKLTEDQFDLYTYENTGKSVSVRSFTWTNKSNVSVQVITYGATITSMKLPDKNGVVKDIVGGGKNMSGILVFI